MPVVLDTHVWVWLMEGQELKQSAVEEIGQSQLTSSVYVSAISVWELAMLVAANKIKIGSGALQWVRGALAQPGVRLEDLTPEIAVESCNLPGRFHGVPADRIVVATARLMGAPLVTHDAKIIKYGQQGFVDVIPA